MPKSGKDRRVPDEELNTNFRIASAGERITLTHYSGGTIIDELPPTEIQTNLSFGRYPDGAGAWYFFENPTPGTANTGEGYRGGGVDPPVFFQKPGFYVQDFGLELEHSNPNATIYYTMDGSDPTTDSAIYSDSVLITIRDRSLEPNYLSKIPTGTEGYWLPPADFVKKAIIIRAKAVKPGYYIKSDCNRNICCRSKRFRALYNAGGINFY